MPSYHLAASDGPDYSSAYQSQENLLNNGQIDWNRIYDANLTSANSGLPAAYVFYEDRADDKQFTANASLKTFLTDEVSLVFNVTHQDLTSENFAEIQDVEKSDAKN